MQEQKIIIKEKEVTRIYLVWNINNKPWRVYIGKEKSNQKIKRKYAHKRKFGELIEFDYIDEINSLDKKDWKSIETYWIKWFKKQGYEVLNKNEGGGGPLFVSEEIRNKLRKPKPKGFGENHSLKMTGKVQSEETKTKRIQKLIGQKRSEETKLKMRKARIGFTLSKKSKNKISKANKGKKRTEAMNIKAGEIRIGKPLYNSWKPILQFDKKGNFIKEWGSQTKASSILKINYHSINNCLKNITKTAGSFIWKYKN